MDEWKGMGISWRVTFNFTVLRMISFSMDYYWNLTKSCAQFEAHLFECRNCESGTQLCDKGRTEKGMLPDEYHIINYLCYLLYAPLYMAGPIISFNNFMQQVIEINYR
jgi:D-alanyl-lipoteichoic acid acyltransferase DltB (MBOAT superfamily)